MRKDLDGVSDGENDKECQRIYWAKEGKHSNDANVLLAK